MLTARSVATAFDTYISACWRGEAVGGDWRRWLESYWRQSLPLQDLAPVARSPHAAGGRGIIWSESETHVIGVVPGLDGCYAIPLDAVAPSIDCSPHQRRTGEVPNAELIPARASGIPPQDSWHGSSPE